jgi:hypothetical protein
MTETSEVVNVEKPPGRRPGRPKKIVTPEEPQKKEGVVDTPSEIDYFIEFKYERPEVFKKLWAFFKSMDVDNIHMAFSKESINIYCKDHKGKSRIRAKIDCRKVNKYYCKEPIDIGLLCKNPQLIMNTIDKTYSSILFLSTCDNIRKNLHIILNNSSDIEESHKIELIGDYEKFTDDDIFLDEDYMIKFKLPGKYFKKMITDIKSLSDQITIKKDGPKEKLIFEYTKNDKKIKSEHIINKSESIELRDNLDEDDTFRISFNIDDVKPFSSTFLSENIEIFADENKPLKFTIKMDEAIEIVILTKIIDLRDNN